MKGFIWKLIKLIILNGFHEFWQPTMGYKNRVKQFKRYQNCFDPSLLKPCEFPNTIYSYSYYQIYVKKIMKLSKNKNE